MSSEKRIKIVLHGRLKKLYPHDLYMSGRTVAEILNGINRQIKELRPIIGDERHFVTVIGYESVEALNSPIKNGVTSIDIMPVMAGNKGGFLQILVGVALIAVSFWNPAFLGLAATGMWSTATLFSFGLSMALGGLIQMLSPAPKIDQTGNTVSDPEASKYLGADQNTVKIGTRVPLPYGRNKIYGHYLSFNIDAKDVAI